VEEMKGVRASQMVSVSDHRKTCFFLTDVPTGIAEGGRKWMDPEAVSHWHTGPDARSR